MTDETRRPTPRPGLEPAAATGTNRPNPAAGNARPGPGTGVWARLARRGRPRTPIAIALLTLLSLAAALVAARVAGPGGPWLWYYDMPRTFYPAAVWAHQAATAVRLPLWNDQLGLGFPLYAEGQIGAFYLPNLLIFRLDPLTALDVTRTLHLTLAGVGAGLIGRRISGSWLGAAVASLGAVLSGGIVGKLEWTDVVVAYAWIPWIFLPLVRRPRPSRLGLVLAGIAWGIQGLAAHPNTWLLTGIGAMVLLIAVAPRRQTLLRVAGFGALGIAVSAVQLIPSLLLWTLSARVGGLPAWDVFSNSGTVLDPLLPGFANALIRSAGGQWDLNSQWYPGGLWGLHEAGMYVGLPLLALAAAGSGARRAKPYLAVIAVMVAIAMLGLLEPSWWVTTPLLNGLRHPARAYTLVGLMLSLLAALGVARVTAGPAAGSLRRAAVVVGGSILAYASLLGLAVALPTVFEAFLRSLVRIPTGEVSAVRDKAVAALSAPYPVIVEVALAATALWLIHAARAQTADRRLLRAGLVVVAAVPLLAFSPGANPQRGFHDFSQADRPYIQAIQTMAPRRFLALRDSSWYDGFPNQLASLHVNELGMWSSLNLRATDQLVDSIWHAKADPTQIDATLARAAGVDVLATFGTSLCPGRDSVRVAVSDATICRLDAARPPYWIPARDVSAAPRPAAADSLARRLLDKLGAIPTDRLVDPSRALADAVPASVSQRDDGAAELTVSAPSDGWVYLDRAWWPAWRTTVDGSPVRADRTMAGQLIPVAMGTHVIHQELVPGEAIGGFLVALVAIMWAVIWLRLGPSRSDTEGRPGRSRRRRRRPPATTVDDTDPAAAPAVAEAASTDGGAAPALAETSGTDPTAEPEVRETVGTESLPVAATAGIAETTDAEPPAAPATPAAPEPDATVADAAPSLDVLAWVTRSPDLLAAVAIALVLATLVLPPLAVLVVWPFLTVVPGWLLAARVAPWLSAPGRLGVGIVTSVFVASHLVNAVADIAGFGPRTIILCAIVLMAASWILARRPLPYLAAPPVVSRQTVGAALRRDRVAWALAAGVAGAILLILGLSAWHQTPAGWVSGGWNWSDFLVHVAIGNSIIHGNFPPQVPYFVGVPLSYHWFADFHGAILAAVARISIIPVFIVSSAAMAGTLALVVWELARQLTRNRRVAAIAVILVCFGGGLGWLRLVLDLAHGQGSLLDLVTKNPYDNSWAGDWPFFRIASVLGTGLLPHRATTFGLPGLVAGVVLVHGSLGRRPAGMLLAGILAALLAPFQFFFFPATYLIVLLLVVARRAWRRPTMLRDAVLFLAPVALALPFVIGPALRQGESGAFRFVLGWGEARFGDGPLAVLFFYVTNLGLPVLLALIAIVRPGRFPARRFLAIWLVALFVVPNVVVVSSVEFDMNKYFQVLWVAAAILAAWLIARWPRPLIVAILAVSVLSPTLVALWHVRNQSIALTPDQEVTGRWIEVNTPPRAIFVTDAWINSPVDLAGRLRLTGFGPYVANLGYNPDVRAKDVHSVYCDGDVAARAVMARYGASYVLSSGGLLDCGGHQTTDFDASPLFEMVFRDSGTAVWRLIP